ncbi:uncharacterized protein LOC141786088 [Halichoeres trimaculatus]|uniref:uncharacterized protein LOC141786088 n=1 Tax=Halichoeres trimaculatus TaxID=147232 RepID=UPI003D9F434A
MLARMASAFIAAALLTCCCFVSCTGAACDLYALKGGNVKVALKLKLDTGGRLKWTHNNDIIFHQRGAVIKPGKKEDISKDGSLELRNVEKRHEGDYTAETHTKDGGTLGTFGPVRLCVQDSVKQPKVTVTCKSPQVTFNCSDKGEDGKVVWSQDGKVLKSTAQFVTFKAEDVQEKKFACTVSNKVSNSTSVAVKQECYEPGFTLPEEIWGINTWIIIGAGGGIALLLLIIVIFCCIRAKRRKRMHIKDEEELRLGWTNPNQQQHHHHHHPPNQRHHHHHQQHQQHQQHQHQHQHRQQPAGHTGPRPHRPKQQRHKKQPDQYSSQPQPSPRRPAQAPPPADEEKPPPLPQPRKKAPKTPQI